MAYPDESRSEELTLRQRKAYLARDVDKLLDKYEEILAQNRELRQRVASQAKRESKETRRLQNEVGRFKRARDAERARANELLSTLKGLRKSRTMKVGRAVLAPVTFVRDRFLGHGITNASPSRHAEASARTKPTQGTDVLDPDSPEGVFAADPNPQTLKRLLNHLWYAKGDISAAASLVEENPELVEGFTGVDRILCQRVDGARRVQQRGIALPPRSRGTAYVPERGRVMYCVHFTPGFNSNGYATRTKGVANGLAAAGADVTVVARTGYPWDTPADGAKPRNERTEAVIDDVTYVHTPGPNLNVSPVDHYIQMAADAFVREGRRLRPTVIQAASNYLTALPALIAARRLGVPFVYEVRGLWEVTEADSKEGWSESERYAQSLALETQVASEADVVLAITTQVKDELIRRGVEPDRIRIAPNAVDTDVFVPLPKDEEYAREHGIRTDVPVIGFAGSIVPYEGLDLLIEASALMRERGVEHQVVIAGSGKAEPDLQQLVQDSELTQVKLLGRLPIEEMPRLISTFDIMPCPRRAQTITELVSPLKPLEAFASQKPVVLSDVAPHRDLAGERQERAVLFPAGDVEALATALTKLINEPDRMRELGRHARLWTLDQRRWSHLAEQILQVHGTALEHHSRQASRGRDLNSLRVAVIADEFTTETLQGSVDVVPLSRGGWRAQLDDGQFDALFVESAWHGNQDDWFQGVGYYGDDEIQDLLDVLDACERQRIPTIFWNKEDPVHHARFLSTAARFDHVFTTDANMLPSYLAKSAGRVKTAAALPFFAQPKIHNPLPGSLPSEGTVAYAGTHYGDRYKDRSEVLNQILRSATKVGLAIYDRQAALSDSPYQFPDEFKQYVRGSLPYNQVIDSYKAHLAHINVNSVTDSPTMYSRRVVEIAASGGVVLSGPGRGITETFGSVIPVASEDSVWGSLLYDWHQHPASRVAEAWLQMRAVYRAHTAEHALVILFRTVGLAVNTPEQDAYGLTVEVADQRIWTSIRDQSVRPGVLFVAEAHLEAAREFFDGTGIEILALPEMPSQDLVQWVGECPDAAIGRTHFEDLLMATRFGDWRRIAYRTATDEDGQESLARIVDVAEGRHDVEVGLERVDVLDGHDAHNVVLSIATPTPEPQPSQPPEATDHHDVAGLKVLVAGHDLKFAKTFIAALEDAGATVMIDLWRSHTSFDEEASRELLADADVVFCEWGLGNAVWYSNNVRPDQRLVVRIHLQEIQLPYLRKVNHANVDQYIFVGELIRRAAVESHGVPEEKSVVIFNAVNTEELNRTKLPGAEKTLGLVGIVPERKRLDLALELLAKLHEADDSYRLIIKGKRPEEYPWMKERPDEMKYYERAYARAEEINRAVPGSVIFEGHGDDMAEWYRKIGFALSTSDFESFHYTLADGAASGAVPVSLAWGGIDFIYPRDWYHADVFSMSRSIAASTVSTSAVREFTTAHFDRRVIALELLQTLKDERGRESAGTSDRTANGTGANPHSLPAESPCTSLEADPVL